MTNYEQMSDFEINKLVATMHLPCDYIFDGEKQEIVLTGVQTFLGAHGIPEEREIAFSVFNPCNSWADAGPIIEKYGISLEHDYDEWCAKAGNAGIGENGDHLHYGWSKNPLRAAMICFIKMKDAEKNNVSD